MFEFFAAGHADERTVGVLAVEFAVVLVARQYRVEDGGAFWFRQVVELAVEGGVFLPLFL